MDRRERDQQLHQQISRTVLTDPDTAKRYHTDAATHLQIAVLRNLLLIADRAMETEGVDHTTRDRVVHWILVGSPPEPLETDPHPKVYRPIGEAAVPTYRLTANQHAALDASTSLAAARAPQRFTVLVAGTHRECDAWCFENNRSRRDPLIIRVTGPSSLDRVWGISDFDLVVVSEGRHHQQVMAELSNWMGRHQQDRS